MLQVGMLKNCGHLEMNIILKMTSLVNMGVLMRAKTILFRTKKSKLLPVGCCDVGESSRHLFVILAFSAKHLPVIFEVVDN